MNKSERRIENDTPREENLSVAIPECVEVVDERDSYDKIDEDVEEENKYGKKKNQKKVENTFQCYRSIECSKGVVKPNRGKSES